MVSLELHHAFIAKIATKAAILETSGRTAEILRRRTMIVQIGVAGLKFTGQGQGAITIFGPDR